MKLINKIFGKTNNKSANLDHTFVSMLNNTDATVDLISFFKSWSFACVNKRAHFLASVNNYPAIRKKDGTFEYLNSEHWLSKLINMPNTLYGNSWYDLKQLAVKWLDFSGNAFFYFPMNDYKYPTQIYVLPSNKVEPVLDMYNNIVKYRYYSNNGLNIIDKSEICHIKTLSPSSDVNTSFGWGRPELLLAAANSISIDNELRTFIKDYFIREALPPFVLKTEKNMSDAEYQRFKLHLKQSLPDKQIVALLEGGVELLPFAATNTNSNIINNQSSKDNAKLICAIFGVPYTMLDTSENAAYASANKVEMELRVYTISPLIDKFEYNLSNYFQNFEKDICLIHDDIKWNDPEFELKKYDLELKYNLITPNEYRVYNGYDEIEGGDVLRSAAIQNNELTEPEQKSKAVKKKYNDLSEIEKAVIWLQKDYLANLEYPKLVKNIAKTFNQIEKNVISSIENNIKSNIKTKFDDSIFDENLWKQMFKDNCNVNLKNLIKNIFKEIENNPDFQIDSSDIKKITDAVIEYSNKKLFTSTETIKSELNVIVDNMIKEQGFIDKNKLKTNIKEHFSTMKNSRVNLIARTVTTSTSGQTQTKIAEVTNKNVKWISQRDGSVRETHYAADGTLPDDNGYFNIGGDSMQHPGGGSVAAENCNCRCYLYYEDK